MVYMCIVIGVHMYIHTQVVSTFKNVHACMCIRTAESYTYICIPLACKQRGGEA